mmetsp:Transcript_10111/g.24894  ORF Transcript_10111/g.24894 Transcript_10111/m.24894 type:complete len:236 (-) Transcript_10111:2287-2994(-)
MSKLEKVRPVPSGAEVVIDHPPLPLLELFHACLHKHLLCCPKVEHTGLMTAIEKPRELGLREFFPESVDVVFHALHPPLHPLQHRPLLDPERVPLAVRDPAELNLREVPGNTRNPQDATALADAHLVPALEPSLPEAHRPPRRPLPVDEVVPLRRLLPGLAVLPLDRHLPQVAEPLLVPVLLAPGPPGVARVDRALLLVGELEEPGLPPLGLVEVLLREHFAAVERLGHQHAHPP